MVGVLLRLTTLAVLLPLAPAVGYAQLNCTTSKVPIGIVQGRALIEYGLRDGRPDTASISVVAVEGLSARGARSVLVRQLSSCELSKPPVELRRIRQEFAFLGARMRFGTLVAADSVTPGLVESTPEYEAGRVFERGDVEELPRVLRCPALPRASQQPNDIGGDIRAEFVVLATGRVDPSTIVIESGAPALRSRATEAFARCRYVPARRDGVPVAVKVREDARLR